MLWIRRAAGGVLRLLLLLLLFLPGAEVLGQQNLVAALEEILEYRPERLVGGRVVMGPELVGFVLVVRDLAPDDRLEDGLFERDSIPGPTVWQEILHFHLLGAHRSGDGPVELLGVFGGLLLKLLDAVILPQELDLEVDLAPVFLRGRWRAAFEEGQLEGIVGDVDPPLVTVDVVQLRGRVVYGPGWHEPLNGLGA